HAHGSVHRIDAVVDEGGIERGHARGERKTEPRGALLVGAGIVRGHGERECEKGKDDKCLDPGGGPSSLHLASSSDGQSKRQRGYRIFLGQRRGSIAGEAAGINGAREGLCWSGEKGQTLRPLTLPGTLPYSPA